MITLFFINYYYILFLIYKNIRNIKYIIIINNKCKHWELNSDHMHLKTYILPLNYIYLLLLLKKKNINIYMLYGFILYSI